MNSELEIIHNKPGYDFAEKFVGLGIIEFYGTQKVNGLLKTLMRSSTIRKPSCSISMAG